MYQSIKRIKFSFPLLLLALSLGVQAQSFQPLNNGFEQWDGSAIDSEPTHWNSFATSDGTFASMASSPHHYHRHGGHPGTSGSSFLTIYTKSIIGVKANGNMTTGRIHAGAMSAGSDKNYNYTQRSNSNFSQPFTATPDSMYVWVSYYAASASSQASISAFVHGDLDFKDPNDNDDATRYACRAMATFTRTTSSSSSYGWQQVKVPFTRGTATPSYLLISLTSNVTPGAGAANDSLSVSEIQFIYSSWLTDLAMDGVTLNGFAKDNFNYTVHVDDLHNHNITYLTEVEDATVAVDSVVMGDSTMLYTLTVTAEDGITQHSYTVTLCTGTNDEPPVLSITTAEVDFPFVAYPNPAHEQVVVSMERPAYVELIDALGHTLQRQWVEGSATLSLHGLPQGIYLLRTATTTQKLVVR